MVEREVVENKVAVTNVRVKDVQDKYSPVRCEAPLGDEVPLLELGSECWCFQDLPVPSRTLRSRSVLRAGSQWEKFALTRRVFPTESSLA